MLRREVGAVWWRWVICETAKGERELLFLREKARQDDQPVATGHVHDLCHPASSFT
jgi:hypothetical protein